MEKIFYRHMDQVRELTLKAIKQIPENLADEIPNGFNNNIRWNFGHIAYTQEKLCFMLLGIEMGVPDTYETYFAAGTKPAKWRETPSTLEEIAQVLVEQSHRIKQTFPIEQSLPKPFTNKMGVTFNTSTEALLFSFYHEGIHMETIRRLYKLVSDY